MIWFLLTITAVLFITAETVFEKKTLAKARSLDFAAMFAFGNAIVLSPFIFVADFSNINLFVFGIILIASIPTTCASLLIFKTIKHSDLGEAAPILSLLPLVVTLFAFIILGEKISFLQFSGLLLMVAGIIYLELKNLQTSQGIFRQGRGKYIFYIVLYLILGGVSSIFDRLILHRFGVSPLSYLILIQIFIALNYLIFVGIKPGLFKELKQSVSQFWKGRSAYFIINGQSSLFVCFSYSIGGQYRLGRCCL